MQIIEDIERIWDDNPHLKIEFEWEDGTTSEIKEAFPYRIPMYSIPHEYLEVPDDIAALPDLMGFGNMHDLHQALVRDTDGSLLALLEQYMEEKNPAAREPIFYNGMTIELCKLGTQQVSFLWAA